VVIMSGSFRCLAKIKGALTWLLTVILIVKYETIEVRITDIFRLSQDRGALRMGDF
jgi:hypothetical protein